MRPGNHSAAAPIWIIAAALALVAPLAHADVRIDISAPIFPREDIIFQNAGVSFPSTPAGEAAAVADASLVYEALLADCKGNAAYSGRYDAITLWTEGDPPLTEDQLNTNYNLVAECAYVEHTSKPYWIPQLVDDVDICGSQLGAGWAMLSEADLADLTEDEYTFLAHVLTALPGLSSNFGSLYFSSRVYVRANDHTLKLGDMSPGVVTRVTALPATVDHTPYTWLESGGGPGIVLRCIRRTTLPPGRPTLTVSADYLSRAYGDANPTLTATFTGFIDGQTLATSDVTGSPMLSVDADPTSEPRTYAIHCAEGTLSSVTYRFVYDDAKLTVTKRAMTITADDLSRAFGDANPTFTASFSGFALGENLGTSDITGTPMLSTTATPESSIGDYTIAASVGTLSSAHYSFELVNGTLHVH